MKILTTKDKIIQNILEELKTIDPTKYEFYFDEEDGICVIPIEGKDKPIKAVFE